jgi:hydrogenase nickel incorporation protein HypB
MTAQPRLLEIRQNVLKRNDVIARELREQFSRAGVYAVSLVSSPGSGKTMFLEKTLTLLRGGGPDMSGPNGRPPLRVAALVGDLATENDARRLARSGAPVRQIVTGTVCHLEAEMVRTALDGWDLSALDLLFIENVGNLVCPAAYDLGENARAVLMSVTEGEDKPLKYPGIFFAADLAVITKMDLAEAVEFDLEAAKTNIHAVNPGLPVLAVSAKSGLGLDAWLALLHPQSQAPRSGGGG